MTLKWPLTLVHESATRKHLVGGGKDRHISTPMARNLHMLKMQ